MQNSPDQGNGFRLVGASQSKDEHQLFKEEASSELDEIHEQSSSRAQIACSDREGIQPIPQDFVDVINRTTKEPTNTVEEVSQKDLKREVKQFRKAAAERRRQDLQTAKIRQAKAGRGTHQQAANLKDSTKQPKEEESKVERKSYTSLQIKAFANLRPFSAIQEIDPEAYEQACEVLQHQLSDLSNKLYVPGSEKERMSLSGREVRSIKREMWRLTGALLHDFNFELLTEVFDQHELMDEVPIGYLVPGFFPKRA